MQSTCLDYGNIRHSASNGRRYPAFAFLPTLTVGHFTNIWLGHEVGKGNPCQKVMDALTQRVPEILGQAAAPDKKVKKSDYWIIVLLTQIGTSKAVDGLITILEHDYEGDIALDRQVAAYIDEHQLFRDGRGPAA